jgi:uncharacterized protein (DUF433 family)
MALLDISTAPASVTAYPHIVETPGTCGGRPRIDGTRISVQVIAEYYALDRSVDSILDALPHLKAAQVHAALTYYYDNQEFFDEETRKWKDPNYLRSLGFKLYPVDNGENPENMECSIWVMEGGKKAA